MTKGVLFCVSVVSLVAACSTSKAPTAPTSADSGMSAPLAHPGHGVAAADTASGGAVNSAAHEDKGYIDGWFNGDEVQLYYTKSFSCPPLSPGASVPCELGADSDTGPRPGPIPPPWPMKERMRYGPNCSPTRGAAVLTSSGASCGLSGLSEALQCTSAASIKPRRGSNGSIDCYSSSGGWLPAPSHCHSGMGPLYYGRINFADHGCRSACLSPIQQ